MGQTCRPPRWRPPRTACPSWGGRACSVLLHHDRHRRNGGRHVPWVGTVVERRRVIGKLLGLLDELGMIVDEPRAQLARAEISAVEDRAVIADGCLLYTSDAADDLLC